MAHDRMGICVKCRERKPLTRHHLLPLREGYAHNGPIIRLCRSCHDNCEKFIDEKEWECSDRSPSFYLKVNADWLFNSEVRKKAS